MGHILCVICCSKNVFTIILSSTLNAPQRKRRLIALAVFTLLMIQFLLAYNFYSANHDEEDRIEAWHHRVKALEIAHQTCK